MADNYKHLYEQMKKVVEKYQDEIVPGLRNIIEDLREDFVDYVCSGTPNPAPYCRNASEKCVDRMGWCSNGSDECKGFFPKTGERREDDAID